MDNRTEAKHFRLFIVRPTLKRMGMWSPAAEDLIVGTAAHESQFRAFDQVTGKDDVTLGPAYGVYQIEPATFDDINRYLKRRADIRIIVQSFLSPWPDELHQLVGNLNYATAIARVKYWMAPEPLPAGLPGIAEYWNKYYNSYLGAGTPEQFIEDYRFYVGE